MARAEIGDGFLDRHRARLGNVVGARATMIDGEKGSVGRGVDVHWS
jgi:hypothetical protein